VSDTQDAQPGTDQPPAPQPEGGTPPPGPDTPDYWRAQAEANAKALADFRKEIEDKDKTEQQRLNDALTAAQTAAEQAQAEALRYRIGLKHGLPPQWIPRLQGATEAELEADAAELANSIPPASPQQPAPRKPLATLQLGGTGADSGEQQPDSNETFRTLFLPRK
jgi:hypothetical protein